MTLGGYLTSLRRLLRDSSGTLYQQTDLIAFINEARHQRDLDTRLVQKVLGFTLVANQMDYSLTTDLNAGTFLRGVPDCLPRDVISAAFIPNGGTPGGPGLRAPIGRKPYSWVSLLASTSWPSFPAYFAMLGYDQVVVVPPPAFAYPSEWHVVGIFPDLVMVDDVEPMPDPWNDPLPYLAAFVAKDNAQRFDEAGVFMQQYDQRVRRIREGIFQTAIPNPGADYPRGAR